MTYAVLCWLWQLRGAVAAAAAAAQPLGPRPPPGPPPPGHPVGVAKSGRGGAGARPDGAALDSHMGGASTPDM